MLNFAGRKQYCRQGHRPSCCSTFLRGSSKGEKTCGGFADTWRGPHQFAVKIPAKLDLAEAAPMFCGGVTVFSPLKQFGAGTTAKRVGIAGVGGLGHFAILFAKAMGADVTAISHSAHKKPDAEAMGATHFIETGTDPAAACAEHKQTLDLIICTTSLSPGASGGLALTNQMDLNPPSTNTSACSLPAATSFSSASQKAVFRTSTRSPSLLVGRVFPTPCTALLTHRQRSPRGIGDWRPH